MGKLRCNEDGGAVTLDLAPFVSAVARRHVQVELTDGLSQQTREDEDPDTKGSKDVLNL
jgi:hypothetical protein